jgi:hypothetical protein
MFAGLGLGVVAALVTASPSLAASVANAELLPTGTIDARGAAVTISVTYTCSTADQPWSSVYGQITETVGNKVAHAYVSANTICDGAEHTVDLTGTAQDVPFKVGTAFVQGSVSAGDSTGYTNLPFSGEVHLKK